MLSFTNLEGLTRGQSIQGPVVIKPTGLLIGGLVITTQPAITYHAPDFQSTSIWTMTSQSKSNALSLETQETDKLLRKD